MLQRTIVDGARSARQPLAAALCLTMLTLCLPAAQADQPVTRGVIEWQTGGFVTPSQDAATLTQAVDAAARSG